ncbi:MAG: hypothetical protein HYX83_01780, partial [Chloroflexi bacterium]|nr:hypothetical protein [Chloroflexota bacterium]
FPYNTLGDGFIAGDYLTDGTLVYSRHKKSGYFAGWPKQRGSSGPTGMRAIAVAIEVMILAGITFSLLAGVWLTLFDLGLAARYKKMMTLLLLVAGSMAVVFFIAHLTSFYPPA